MSGVGGSSACRGSVCSKRKLAGETPVKDLDPTLKMIIIKELSAEKVDGKFNFKLNFSTKPLFKWLKLVR